MKKCEHLYFTESMWIISLS